MLKLAYLHSTTPNNRTVWEDLEADGQSRFKKKLWQRKEL